MTTAEQLAKVSRQAQLAARKRDELIRQMRAEGATLREIARAADLSHAGVVRVLERQ